MKHAPLALLGVVAILVAGMAQAQPPVEDDGQGQPSLADFHPQLQKEFDEIIQEQPEDLDGLLERRSLILRVIEHLQGESRRQLFALERAKAVEDQIQGYERDLEAARDIAAAAERISMNLKELREDLASHGSTELLRNQIVLIQDRTTEAIARLNDVEARISTFLAPEFASQNFKWRITWIFAAMVGLVILGFFFIANRDAGVRRTIFSGDAGIQFLTLFSLVIAIILFGITGILEGKELAALLGGISGYILGRTASGGGGNSGGGDGGAGAGDEAAGGESEAASPPSA